MSADRLADDAVGPFSCRSIDERDGSVDHCGVVHRAMRAARKCIRSTLQPALFEHRRGEIVFRGGGQSDRVVERYQSAERAARRGRDVSLSARWVLDETPSEPPPEVTVVRPPVRDAVSALGDYLRERGLLSSVGIGGTSEAPVIYAYVRRKIALDEWSGYPVVVRRVGKIVPLAN